MSKTVNYQEGQIIGKLVFVRDITKEPNKSRRAFFLCPICNKEFESNISNVKAELSTKCRPCSDKLIDRSYTIKHGFKNHPLYAVWTGMKQRCYNPVNLDNKPHYYDRAIKVCEEWLNNPEEFCRWSLENGYSKGLQIDRKNPDKDYSPENCRWVTPSINQRNRRKKRNSSSKFIGVSFNKDMNLWKVGIRILNKTKHLGYYRTEEEAVQIRNNYIIENNVEGYNIQ